MIIDARRLEAEFKASFDVCIVGAGIAGISLAMSLARKGRTVCLLEGGGEHFSRSSQALYDGVTWDRRYSLSGTRTRMLGGSSNCWGGWTRPPNSIDFAPRPWLGGLGWPISESDLSPYYAEASELLEVEAPKTDASFLASLDPDAAAIAGLGGESFGTVFFSMSTPTNFGKAYRSELAALPNISVLLNATVVELETDESSDRVVSAVVRTARGTFAAAGRVFVLAAGGIENPRLLLASRTLRKAGIGNQHDLVGRYFMDHPRVRLRHLRLNDPTRFTRLYDARHYGGGSLLVGRARTGAAFSPTIAEQEKAGVLQTYTGLVACYFGRSDSTLEDPRQIYQALTGRLHDRIGPGLLARAATQLPGALAYLLGRRFDIRGRDTVFEVETVIEPLPDPENRVELLAQTDPNGVPMVRLTWRKHDIERRSHKHAVGLVRQAIESGGHGRLSFDPQVWETERWEAEVMTTWHHMGTTRMAAVASRGVVDLDCRVFGTQNLFVSGSSIFPTGGGSPPTFAVAALALRLADHVDKILAPPSTAVA